MTNFDLSGLNPNDIDRASNPDDHATPWQPDSPADKRLDESLNQQRRNADRVFFADFMESTKFDPEKAAEARKLGLEVGRELDDETIANNLGEVRRIASGIRVKRMDLATSSPVLRMQLEVPEFRKIAWDQTEELSSIEGLFNNVRVGWLENEIGKLGSAAVGRELTAPEAQRLAQLRGRIAALRNDDIPFLSPAARLTGQIAESIPTIALGTGTGAAVGSAVPGLGTAAGAGYGAVTAMAIDAYRVNSGQLYLQMIDQGYSIESATTSSIASGIVNAGLEVLGGKIVSGTGRRLLKDKLLEKAGQKALQPLTTSSSLRRRLAEYATAVGGETATEVAQEMVNIFAEEVALRDESNRNGVHPETGEPLSSTYGRGETLDVLVDTAIEVAQGMAVLGISSPGFGAASDRRGVAQVQSTQEFLGGLKEGVDKQKLAERSPDQFEQFLSQLAGDTPAENVHIRSDEMERVLVEQGITPEQLRSQFPDIANQLEKAKGLESNGFEVDIVIPMEQFSKDIVPRTTLFEQLKPHVRLDGDQLSMAELERDQEAIAAEMDRSTSAVEKKLEAGDIEAGEISEIGTELVGQLVDAGITDRESRDSISPLTSFVAVRARQARLSPKEFFEAYRPAIQRRLKDPASTDGELKAADGGGKSKGTFGRRSRTINLHKKADPSTFLHESSHYFVDVTIDMIREQVDSQKLGSSYLDRDVNDMFDWFEVGNASMSTKDRVALWDALSPEEQSKKHESFAYNWEIYLSEGKAPSKRLQRVFSKIAAWMRSLYTDIRDRLNKTYRDEFGEDLPALTDDLRSVMDRMLEAQEIIDAQQQIRAGVPEMATQEESGMTDAQWDAYQESRDLGDSRAIDELTAQLMKDTRWAGRVKVGREREINKAAQAKRKEIAAEESQSMRKERVHRVRRFLRSGERTSEDGAELGADDQHKLSTAAVRALLPGVDLRSLGRITTPEGLDPGQVAGSFGYDSATQMLDELRTAPTLESSVRERTADRMRQEHGDLTNPESIKAGVLHALYNETRMRAIAEQLRVAERLGSTNRVRLEAAKRLASDRIAATPIKSLQPHRYEQQAIRSRRAAFRALRSDDRAAAADAFRAELLYSMMVREAARVKLEVDKARRRVATYFKSDKRIAKSRDMSYVSVARAVLSWAGLGSARKSPQEHVDKLQRYEPEMFDRLKPAYDRAEANAVDDHRKLTVEQFRESIDVADMLWDRGRTSKQLDVAGKKIDLEILDAELLSALEANNTIPTEELGATGAVTDAEKRSISRGKIGGLIRRAEWWAMETEGGIRGIITRTLVEHVQQATYAYQDAKRGRTKQLQEMLERINKLTKDSPRELFVPELGERGYTFGQGAQNAVAEILGAVVHSGTQSSLDRLLADNKRKWGPRPEPGAHADSQVWFQVLQRLVDDGIVTREMLDLVQGYWLMNEQIKPKLQETAKRITGFNFEELEAQPFTLTFGDDAVTFEGGYAPARYDRNASETAGRIEDQTERATANAAGRISLTPSFIKERASIFADTIDLDLRQTLLSFDSSLKWAYIAPAVKDVHTVLTRTEFARQLEKVKPGGIESVLTPMLDRALTQTLVQANTPFDKFMRGLRQMVGMNALTFNIPNSLQNYLGAIPVSRAIGPRWTAYGFANADWEFASQQSGLMRARADKTQQEMAEEMTEMVEHPSAVRTVAGKARRFGYFLPSISQKHMDIAAWTGAYHKWMNDDRPQGMSDEDAKSEASLHADHVVRTELSSTDIVDSAAYEGVLGEFGRLFTQFSSWFNNLGEQQRNIWIRTVKKMGYRGLPQFFFEWFQVVYGQLVAGAAISMILRGQYDEDDEDGLEAEAMQLMLLEPLQGAGSAAVPIVGQFAAKAASSFIYEDPRSYAGRDRLLQAPAITALERTLSGLKNIGAATVSERDLDSRALRTVLDIVSVWSGAPVGAVSGQLGYLVDLLSGKVKPRSASDAVRGVVVGSASQGTRQR